MTKSRNALADTAARIVEAINRLHERIGLVEDAVFALDERTGTRSASGYETRSMSHNKPRLRSVNGQWLMSEQGRAEGAAAARLMRTGRARWDTDQARWVEA